MYRYTIILFLLAVGFISISHAQELAIERSDSVAKIENKVFLIHTIKPKQTLFSIAKAYGVKLSSIAFDNPEVMEGIQPGQFIRIDRMLLDETSQTETAFGLEVDGDYVLYEVPAKKTLYSISKEYNTTISAIIDANPELSDGLKVGSTIRIPVQKLLPETKNKKVEMIGLPDMVKQDWYNSNSDVSPKLSSEFNAVALLPLYFTQNDTISARQTLVDEESIYGRSEMALQFYEGMLLALDSLSKLGYKVNLKIIDTENRPWKMQQLIKQGKLKGYDLIIGPFYSKVFAVAAKYADEFCIPIVSPTIQGKTILKDNPYVFKIIPSNERMISYLGSYLAKSDSTNNFVLHYGKAEDQVLLWRFRQGLELADTNFVATFPAYNVNKIGKDSVRLMLSLTKRNNVVVLSESELNVSSLIRKMSNWTEDAYIVAYAPSSWNNFKSLDIDHFDRLRVHLPRSFFVDYQDLKSQKFVLKFKTAFSTEPSTFAFRGYDILMHFVQNLEGIIEDGPTHMLSVKQTGLQSRFDWTKEESGGFENQSSRIVDYTDLNLKLATD